MGINTVVVHLPDPDKGHNPAAVSHLLAKLNQRKTRIQKDECGAHQLWAGPGEDSASGQSRSG